MNSKYDPRGFEFAISSIRDGNIFEKFAQDILAQVQSYEFTPAGGTHDRGIDGLERTFEAAGINATVFQISIEKNTKSKVTKTLKALKKHEVQYNRLYYVSNQLISDQDLLADHFFNEFSINVLFRDLAWFRANILSSEGTLRTYLSYVETYFHTFPSPSDNLQISDLHSDPRVFVFLRQQWDDRTKDTKLDELIADSLILYALEGTDPDKNILRSTDEIMESASKHVRFSISKLESTIKARLALLSRKPNRKVNHHTREDKYCLPYLTRLDVEQKKLDDAALHASFATGVQEKLSVHLEGFSIAVEKVVPLLLKTINQLFRKQGLEFADFIINDTSLDTVENSLSEIISEVVDEGFVNQNQKEAVKQGLLGTIRQIIYQGTRDEIEYLTRLSDTYLMLFLLQCDPKISLYFSAMASELRVLVGNSIIVPAISEFPLQERHRRHWNLLVKANAAGVKLYVTRETIKELAAHLHSVSRIYREQYEGLEDIYNQEMAIKYVNEILIRSYLYGLTRNENSLSTFDKFLDNFVTIGSENPERELYHWLNGNFGIELFDAHTKGVEIDKDEYELLAGAILKSRFKSKLTAQNDAKTILMIHAIRKESQEDLAGNIYGYRTWWLSKDTVTQRAVSSELGGKYGTNAYMRADFLNNYIALSPKFREIEKAYSEIFPTLVGVSLSHHIPPEVRDMVVATINEHREKDHSRVSAIVANLSDKLKSDAAPSNPDEFRHYLDERFADLN